MATTDVATTSLNEFTAWDSWLFYQGQLVKLWGELTNFSL